MKKLLFNIRLSHYQLWLCLGAMLVINLLVLSGTWAAHTLQVKDNGLRLSMQLLDLAREYHCHLVFLHAPAVCSTYVGGLLQSRLATLSALARQVPELWMANCSI